MLWDAVYGWKMAIFRETLLQEISFFQRSRQSGSTIVVGGDHKDHAPAIRRAAGRDATAAEI